LVLENYTTAYLELLLIEADFYQLLELVELLKHEVYVRKELQLQKEHPDTIVNKAVDAPEVNHYLGMGWTYVDHYLNNETTACSSSGTRTEARWRSNRCTACGEQMSFEKFSVHVTFYRPTTVVLQKRQMCNPQKILNFESNSAGELVFDESFG
jgi:hypothetical protein